MLHTDHVPAGPRLATRRLPPWTPVLLLLLALAAWATPPPDRVAEVGVVADLTRPGTLDTVSVRIAGNADQQLVNGIAMAIAMQLDAVAEDLHASHIDPNFIGDGGVGAEFRAPVMARAQDGLLPLEPFVEAIAPHAGTVRIAYVITGPFSYRGYQQYDNPDVSFTVDAPKAASASESAVATYGVRATIKNQVLTTAMPTYPPPPVQETPRRWPMVWLVVGAVVVGSVAFGIAGVLLLPRLKAWAASGEVQAKGAPDDRER